MTQPRTIVLGTGHWVPERVVTNAELAGRMDTSDEWIRQRTGIEQRRWVDWDKEPLGSSDLGARAATRAMEAAGVAPAQIELIIHATLSPDFPFPGDAPLIQVKTGIPAGVPCLDIRNQCTGFLYSLATADAMIRAGLYRRVLVAGAEVHSSGLDISDKGRDVSVIFGDGGAAVVLGAHEAGDGRGLLSTQLHADGRFAEALCVKEPSSAHLPRGRPGLDQDPDFFPRMQGKLVFKEAVTQLPVVINAALAKAGLTVADVDWLIPHQANLRINESVQQRLGIAPEKVINNIQRYGNTTAASIPLALDETVRAGKLKPGQVVVFAAFGAGFTWGAAVMRW